MSTLDDYEWPTCTACQRNLRENEHHRWVCWICQDHTSERLAQLPDLFTHITKTAALHRTQHAEHAAVSGSHTPPAPVNLTVLALAAVGGVATRLQAIEDSWRTALGRRIEPVTDASGTHVLPSWRANAARAVPEHVNFLRINLERACERYESVGQDIDEIRTLVAECKQALTPDTRPTRVTVGRCPVKTGTRRCGQMLTANARTAKVRCPECGTEWKGYAGWTELRAGQEEALAEVFGAALRSTVTAAA